MSTNEIKWQNLDLPRFYTMQSMLFLGIRAVLFPTAVIKTHMQVTARGRNATMRYAAQKIYRRHGIRGFWKGFVTLGVGVVPAQLCYMFTLENVKEVVGRELEPLKLHKTQHEAIRTFFGGGCASLASQLIIVPVDVVSSRLMIQGSKSSVHNYASGFDGFRQILRTEGIQGLYRGALPSLLAYMPFSAIWWGTYAASKNTLYRATNTVEADTGFSSGRDFVLQATSGAMAAVTGVILTNPIDVMKTRMQTQTGSVVAAKGGIRANAQLCWREQGFRAFFTGSSVRIMGSLPFSIFAGTTYELIKKLSHVPPTDYV